MDLKHARQRLKQERARLIAMRDAMRSDLVNETPGDDGELREMPAELSVNQQHPADMGTEQFEQTKTYSILTSVEADLLDVERALERVKDRTYGRCVACHRPIPAARLQTLPAARFCVKDQALAEREVRAS
jgi:RNA polymerase-binding transcription factor DksA